MINFYEILEVSQKASNEVIEKAYRVLAKKYHPDLQKDMDKAKSEEKMKQINEAYEILSNLTKRQEYDLKLEQERRTQEIQEEQRRQKIEEERIAKNIKNENIYEKNIKQNENEIKNEFIQDNQNISQDIKDKQVQNNEKRLQNAINDAYAQAYKDYWRSRGYRIKEPWTFKRVIELLKVLLIILAIILAIWFFPPTHKLLIEFYEGNIIVKTVIDVTVNLLKGIFSGVWQFFASIFKI